MPVNNNSAYHRIRMMLPGETIRFPFADYSKVRTACSYLHKTFGSYYAYSSTNYDDKGTRYVTVTLTSSQPLARKIVSPFVLDGEIPFVNISFANSDENYLAMFDSGAEITLIDSTIAKEMNMSATSDASIDIKGINGDKSCDTVIYDADVHIKSGGEKAARFIISGFASDLSDVNEHISNTRQTDKKIAFIIGGDTLKKLNASIDYKAKKIYLNDTGCK